MSTPAALNPHTYDLVRDFGLHGDAVTDEHAALVDALTGLPPGSRLRIPAGREFCHSGVLEVLAPDVTLFGGGILTALAPDASCVKLQAARPTVDGITFRTRNVTGRGHTTDDAKVLVNQPADGAVLRNVTVETSSSFGIYVRGATDYRIENPHISDSGGDGIHQTYGASRGRITMPHIIRPGDDGISIVSYDSDPGACEDITVLGARIDDQRYGRGLTAVGGHRITFRDFVVDGAWGSALLASVELGYQTTDLNHVLFERGTVRRANTAAPATNYGAVLIVNERDDRALNDIVVRDVSIIDTNPAATRVLGAFRQGTSSGPVAGIVLADLTISGTAPATTLTTNLAPSELTQSNIVR